MLVHPVCLQFSKVYLVSPSFGKETSLFAPPGVEVGGDDEVGVGISEGVSGCCLDCEEIPVWFSVSGVG